MRTAARRRTNDSAWARILVSIVVTFVHAFVLALPVMWLSAFLAGEGWAITPLGYWASYFTALMLSWIIDGSGTIRRATERTT
jgi:hypothetical protein